MKDKIISKLHKVFLREFALRLIEVWRNLQMRFSRLPKCQKPPAKPKAYRCLATALDRCKIGAWNNGDTSGVACVPGSDLLTYRLSAKSLFENGSMDDSPPQEAAQGDVDHRLGDVDPFFVVAHQATPARHPSEGSFDHPPSRQDLEALLAVDAPDHLDHEVLVSGFVHERAPVVGAVGEEMLDPWPALADLIEDHLRAGAVGDVGGGQVDHEEPAVGVDRDVALASDDLLAGVVAASLGAGRLDALAVDDAGRRARLAPNPFAIDHHRHVVDRLEEEPPHEAAKPPVDGPRGRKILWQHAPPGAGARHVTDGVQNLAKIGRRFASALGRLRQERSHPLPLLIREIGRVALGLLRDIGHPATAC